MSFALAFDRLAAKRIEGVAEHYDLRFLPDLLDPGALPARILELDFTYSDAVHPLGFGFEQARLRAFVLYTLCVRFLSPANDPDRMADMPLWYDRFISSFRGDWLLEDALLAPVAIDVMRAGLVGWAGMTYVGAVFRVGLEIRIDYDGVPDEPVNG